jgi:hypothetical protein
LLFNGYEDFLEFRVVGQKQGGGMLVQIQRPIGISCEPQEGSWHKYPRCNRLPLYPAIIQRVCVPSRFG